MTSNSRNDETIWGHLQFGGLQRTTNLWGNDIVFPGTPPLAQESDVYYVPWENHGRWGIFHKNDTVVEATVDRAHSAGELLQQIPESPTTYNNINVKAVDGDYTYGGRFHPHFGHFLVEALPRYWSMALGSSINQKIVVHTNAHLNFFQDFPFAQTIFTSLGLRRENFVHFESPTIIDKLTVPHVSLRPQAFGYEAYGRMCRHIGKEILKHKTVTKIETPVWLSKARLNHGVSRFVNEHVVDAYLASHGVEIVYPEELSFSEQLALFSSRSIIAGTTGSAFHTSIFVEEKPKMILIDPVGFLNSNFSIFNKLSENRGEHYFPAGTDFVTDHRFVRAVAFPEPTRVAAAIIDLIYDR